LILIGQPAEEIGAGASAMLNDGLFTRFPNPHPRDSRMDLEELPRPTGLLRDDATDRRYGALPPYSFREPRAINCGWSGKRARQDSNL
jgi:hypothetical protein